MATTMQMAALELLPGPGSGAQRVAILTEPRRLELGWAAIPHAGPGEVRVKIKYVGICGSDIEAYRGTRKPEFLSTPARLGHEVAGVIDEVGAGVVGLHVGDRVTCRYVWGAFAEYLVCQPFNVKVVPDRIPMMEVSLLEVLPGVIHAADLAQIDSTKSVLVMGQGVSGLVLTQVLRLYSPKALAVTDLRAANLELACRYGATHTYQLAEPSDSTRDATKNDFPGGFDVVVPCLLEGDGVVDAIESSALNGRIVLYGCIGTCHRPVDFFLFHRRRLEMFSTEPRSDLAMRKYFDQGVGLVLDGLVNTGEMITDILPLERIQAAFELRDDERNSSIHVLIDCESS